MPQPVESLTEEQKTALRGYLGLPNALALTPPSELPPADPVDGQWWLNEEDGIVYVWAWGAWTNPFSGIPVDWNSITNKPEGMTPIITSVLPLDAPTGESYAWWDPESRVLSFWDTNNSVWVGAGFPVI